jgi:other hect domain ubiquitin protein ligase E3
MVFTRLKDASGSSGDDAEKPKARPGFIQAFEQTKTTDVSIFRQPKPQGGLPHLAFRAVFRGEDVEGDGGPYRQVFQDWSSELQPKKEAESPAGAELLDLLKPCANQTGGEPIGKDRFVLNTGNNSAVDL